MGPARLLTRSMGGAARHPGRTAAVVLGVAVLAAVVALLTLQPRTSADTLLSGSSPELRASEAHAKRFGDDAIYVLARQPVTKTVLTDDLLRTLSLEGCLAGTAPNGSTPPGGTDGPCARLARDRPAQVVVGPGTFINESVGTIQDELTKRSDASSQRAQAASAAARQLAKSKGWSQARQDAVATQAAQLVQNEFLRDTSQLALRYGLSGVPNLQDTAFVTKLVFDAAKPAGTPKQQFAFLFPSRNASLIQVRLDPDLSPGAREEAIRLIRAAVALPAFKLTGGSPGYVVSGAPVLLDDLTGEITDSLVLLLAGAVGVMALVLLLVLRARRRLVPLVVALAATAITFGLLALSGAELTMAAVAALPVLIGLSVDYAIQLQARMEEERRRGAGPRTAAARVARRGAPTVLCAAAATAAGLLALQLSPVPQVRDFGLLVVVGIAVSVGCALTLGTALLAVGERAGASSVPRGRLTLPTPRVPAALADGVRRVVRGAVRGARRRPGRVLAVAGVVAAVGWVLGSTSPVQSDLQRLVPQDTASLRDLGTLQRATGVAGEVDVLVRSDRLTDPDVVRWMSGYQQRVLRAAGYDARRGCTGAARLCPSLSLGDLVTASTSRDAKAVQALLDAVPAYLARNVVTADRRSASLAFGIRLMSVERQGRVIAMMRRALDPPAGVTATLGGLPVVTAAAQAQTSSAWRRALLLALSLLAVAAVLAAVLRSVARVVVPLVPIVLATGWSGALLWALGIELNPLSVTLGALVVAVSTEFSVLLSERYRAERQAGAEPDAALRRAYASTGTAVVASGLTALAGFAVLALSDIALLRDFGWVTVIDLGVSVAGVLLVLPAVLAVLERRRPVAAPEVVEPARRRRGAGAGAPAGVT